MKFLENLIGKTNFQKIFQDYIIRFTKQSISYHDYINVFTEHVNKLYSEKESEEILKKIDWEKWIFSKGELIVKMEFSKNKFFDKKKFRNKMGRNRK